MPTPNPIQVDVAKACLDKGFVPTAEDIENLTAVAVGRLDEMGYHSMIDELVKDYYCDNLKPEANQLSLFKETA